MDYKESEINCLICHYRHKDNGNCTAVGGFCTAVPAAYCPLIPELIAKAEKAEKVIAEIKGARDKTKPSYVVDDILRKFYAGKENEHGTVDNSRCKGK